MNRKPLLALTTAIALGAGTVDASAQAVIARLMADDHHMLFLSSTATAPGVIMAQGSGWNLEHDARFYLYGGLGEYFIHIWVQDVGGSLAGVMGDFKIVSSPEFPNRSCRFDSGSGYTYGSNFITTNTTYWKATTAQAQSTPWAPIPGDFGGVMNNSMPTSFLTPTYVPFDLGDNTFNGSPWPYRANTIDPTARWLNNPQNSVSSGQETWYSAHIVCKSTRGK